MWRLPRQQPLQTKPEVTHLKPQKLQSKTWGIDTSVNGLQLKVLSDELRSKLRQVIRPWSEVRTSISLLLNTELCGHLYKIGKRFGGHLLHDLASLNANGDLTFTEFSGRLLIQ